MKLSTETLAWAPPHARIQAWKISFVPSVMRQATQYLSTFSDTVTCVAPSPSL